MSRTTTIDRRDAALIALAIVPFLLLVAVHWRIAPAVWAGEYAQYILGAKSLLSGQGFTTPGYIYSPYNPLSAHPRPGLTLALVPVVAIFGTHSVLLKVSIVLMGIAFLVLVGVYMAQHEGRWYAPAAVILTGIAVEVAYATNAVLPDLGFCALLWSVITLADAPGDPTWRRAAWITVLGFGAMSFRLPGIALLPAMLLFAVLETRPARLWFLAPVVCWLAALLAASSILRRATPPDQSSGSLEWLVRLFLTNVSQYPPLMMDAALSPFASVTPTNVWRVVAAAIALVGLVTWSREGRRTFAGAFAIIFTLLLLIAPTRDVRYVWPLLPLVALWFARGIARLLAPLARRFSWRTPERLALVPLAVLAAITMLRVIGHDDPPTLLDRGDTQRVFARLREMHRASPIRVMFAAPRILTLETGVPAMGTLRVPEGVLFAELQRGRITHVVVGSFGFPSQLSDSLTAAIDRHPERFHQEMRDDDYTLWRVVPEGATDR